MSAMELPAPLNAFLAERTPRERQLLFSGAIVLGALMAYLVLVQPAASGIAAYARLIPQANQRAAELEALVGESRSLRKLPTAASASAADARSALDQSIGAAGLQYERKDAGADADLRYAFRDAPFAKWLAWLSGAERNQGVRASFVRIRPSATPGNAEIELGLRLPHG
jgi:general secretion pathway protein M